MNGQGSYDKSTFNEVGQGSDVDGSSTYQRASRCRCGGGSTEEVIVVIKGVRTVTIIAMVVAAMAIVMSKDGILDAVVFRLSWLWEKRRRWSANGRNGEVAKAMMRQ